MFKFLANENGSASTGGTSILGLLGLVFVTLKLLGKLDWSWWYVTMPFWGLLALAAVIIIFGFIMILFATVFGKPKTNIQIGGRNNRQITRNRLQF